MKCVHLVIITHLIATAWGAGVLLAQEPDEQSRRRMLKFAEKAMQLERLIPVWMDSAGVEGLAIAVAIDGEVAGGGTFGVKERGSDSPVDENTVFEAASLSKPVFAFGVLKLMEQGKLNLDRPLHEYLPNEDLVDDKRYKKITARMILSHSSGLPNWRNDESLRIGFMPGSKFSYSGEGYVYLARVIEKITGEPLHKFLRREVLEPLGMWNSSYIWEARFEANHSVGHGENGEPTEKSKPKEANSAASLHTTAVDYATFLAAMMRGEELQEETYAEWLSPQVEVAEGVSWGLGWGLQQTAEGNAFWHWGDNRGYKAHVLVYPQERLGLVMFMNSDNGMGLVRPVLAAAVGGRQPGLDWLGYERFNSPGRVVRQALEKVLAERGVQKAIEEYHDLKRHYPSQAFTENLLNRLGYRLMGADRTKDAIQLFKLNVQEYPEASNPYDSLGEAYMNLGETELAIENYERSVELNPDNVNGHEMLEKLKEQIE